MLQHYQVIDGPAPWLPRYKDQFGAISNNPIEDFVMGYLCGYHGLQIAVTVNCEHSLSFVNLGNRKRASIDQYDIIERVEHLNIIRGYIHDDPNHKHAFVSEADGKADVFRKWMDTEIVEKIK